MAEWPTIWRYTPRALLSQLLAYCWITMSHYLNQYWLTINKVQPYSFEESFTRDTWGINYSNDPDNYLYWISFKSPRVPWIKTYQVFYCQGKHGLDVIPAWISNQSSVRWNYLLKLWNDKLFHHTLHWACDYLPLLRIRLIQMQTHPQHIWIIKNRMADFILNSNFTEPIT